MMITVNLAALLVIGADLAHGITGRNDGVWSPQPQPASNDTIEGGDTYCRFYSDSKCNNQVGKVGYDPHNPGCFRNSGRYLYCHFGDFDAAKFVMIQSPNNDGKCNCQVVCWHFDQNIWDDECIDLVKFFPTTHYWTWRFINRENGCPKNNCQVWTCKRSRVYTVSNALSIARPYLGNC